MGPLEGVKVIELAGIGPAPMCAMLLADLGATVLRIDRLGLSDVGIERPLKYNTTLRNRSSITLDLKREASLEFARQLIASADILIEGFRPGTMERIGLGPDTCLAITPHLVYGRMTGWGQDGPLAHSAGHDLNYIALSGALHAIGRKGQPPTPPLNLVGDFGGGAMLLAFGLLAALVNARATGRGQVVDAAMLDGAATLMTSFFGMHSAGMHSDERGTNMLDSGRYFYDVYECADAQYIAVAPIESKFRKEFFSLLGIAVQADEPEEQLRARIFALTDALIEAIVIWHARPRTRMHFGDPEFVPEIGHLIQRDFDIRSRPRTYRLRAEVRPRLEQSPILLLSTVGLTAQVEGTQSGDALKHELTPMLLPNGRNQISQ